MGPIPRLDPDPFRVRLSLPPLGNLEQRDGEESTRRVVMRDTGEIVRSLA